jgi:hypothetical protein
MIPEELLCEAAARSCEAYVSYLEADYDAGETYEFSKAFEKRIDKLKRRADRPVFYQTVRRVAIILLAILFAGTIWIAVDSDARAAFVGWFGEFTGHYFEYHHVGSVEKPEETAGAPAGYRPTWIPEEYSEDSVYIFDNETTVRYKNNCGDLLRFSYVITNEETDWFFNTSKGYAQPCCVGDYNATLFISESEDTASSLTWADSDDVAFHVTGFVSEPDLVRIAESVQRIDYLPAWIPEGYAEKSVRVFDDKTTVRYLNDGGELLSFSYVNTHEAVDWSFDISKGSVQSCCIGDYSASLFVSNSEDTASFITWVNEYDTVFSINGFISETELIRIAESTCIKN